MKLYNAALDVLLSNKIDYKAESVSRHKKDYLEAIKYFLN